LTGRVGNAPSHTIVTGRCGSISRVIAVLGLAPDELHGGLPVYE
jgi:hypothetical protein